MGNVKTLSVQKDQNSFPKDNEKWELVCFKHERPLSLNEAFLYIELYVLEW